MDVHAAYGEETTLRRIIALLAALAILAEQAAARSFAVRWLVLQLLRRAERASEAFVFEATGMPAIVEGFDVMENGPADALRLAAHFRALAAALAALLALPCRRDRRAARRAFASGHALPVSGRSSSTPTPRPNDTS